MGLSLATPGAVAGTPLGVLPPGLPLVLVAIAAATAPRAAFDLA